MTHTTTTTYTIAGVGSIRHRVNESPAGRVAAAIAAADPTDGDLDLFDPSVRARLDADMEQSWCIQIVLDADADQYLDAFSEVVAYMTESVPVDPDVDGDEGDERLTVEPLDGRGPTAKSALDEWYDDGYEILSVRETHDGHDHARDEDDACVFADLVIVVERSGAHRDVVTWSSDDGALSVERL